MKGFVAGQKICEMKTNKEFENFNRTMDKLLKVSHTELKAKLDAEKRAKGRKPKKASGLHASGAKHHGSV